jgi:GNAT superfamily N-acetyltransferase
MHIRTAHKSELEHLRAIELAAGIAFAEIGMTDVATAEPPPVETLAAYQRDGRAWVQAGDDDRAFAYLIVDLVDSAVHIEQVSVDPAFAGRGLGAELIEQVATWARSGGYAELTLTTFVEVAWNGPYYERIGFRYLRDDELTPGLQAIRAQEAAHGLDRWPRAAMVRSL